MLEGKKGKGVRLYIYQDDEPALAELLKTTGLSNTVALSIIISAGLQALKREKYRFTLPLRFEVSHPEEKEEPPSKRGMRILNGQQERAR